MIRPLADKIVLEMIPSADKTKAGILLPETAKERPSEGIVISVGPGKHRDKDGTLIPLTVKPGQKVMIAKWTGVQFNTLNKQYLLVSEDDILGIVG